VRNDPPNQQFPERGRVRALLLPSPPEAAAENPFVAPEITFEPFRARVRHLL
jgi:hypothetical protein